MPNRNRDIFDEINELKRRIRDLETSTKGSSAVSDGKSLVIGNGGEINVKVQGTLQQVGPNGNVTFALESLTGDQARPDGQPQPVFRVFRDDGSLAFAILDDNPLDDQYAQRVALYDREGHVIVSDDAAGWGLGSPTVHYPLARVDEYFSTSSTSFVDAFIGVFQARSPVYSIEVRYDMPGTDTAEVQVLFDGNLAVDPTVVSSTGTVALDVDVSARDPQPGLNHEVTVQARLASGAGPAQIGIKSSQGKASA